MPALAQRSTNGLLAPVFQFQHRGSPCNPNRSRSSQVIAREKEMGREKPIGRVAKGDIADSLVMEAEAPFQPDCVTVCSIGLGLSLLAVAVLLWVRQFRQQRP